MNSLAAPKIGKPSGTAPSCKQNGFTLLEAVVTLTILAVFAGGLLAWLNNSVVGYQKLDAVQERMRAFRNAADFVATVNPLVTPIGRIELPPYTVVWQATEIEPVRTATQNSSYYDVGLYTTLVSIDKGGEHLGSFSIKQVGYRQTVFPDF